ncbi:ATP-binding protein [Pullulanibacillus sp. KACC 23026]|uniref:ATP-binding protein n=1 Tax=Pullulanibacillus sp. KACC 23026 TaxID=3028315 RepID=UPI0023B09998|nr:ATP-binding protein [Pullulanibacillus sp. KACC 23026]WEG11418.1 ATP-binding protein [Pullulanibacillus sp. KACC 23026]
MLWRSVVGKLWLTILLLVSAVLIFLTILLLQFFETFHITQVENQMTQIGKEVATIISEEGSSKKALATASQITDVLDARVIIYSEDGHYWISPNASTLPAIPKRVLQQDGELSKVLSEQKLVKKNEVIPFKSDQEEKMVVVGVPFTNANGKPEAAYVYQSLDVIHQTNTQAQKIIYIGAGIAIILTTIFAFFLSTRITAPLRSMREAAQQVTKGNFNAKVPILTRDEIGELGITFNQMASQLKTNIMALQQEKEQLSGILSSMADGVMTFDKDGQLLVSNPPAKRFLLFWEYEKNEEEGIESVKEGVHRLPPELIDLFKQVAKEEKEQTIEMTYQGRTWVVVMTPLYDQNDIRGAVAVLRDMTEERRLDEMRQGFIANVSHELRTPISMLQGYSEAIVDGVAETEEDKKEMAKIIYDESLRMGRLVNELLDLARLEAGHFQMQVTETHMHDFLDRAVGKFRNLAREQEIRVELIQDIDKELVLSIDPDRIEQVLTNLIDNAIRHTPRGGTVTVLAEPIPSFLKVSVSDTGTGISKEDLPFVFERFYKADKARTRGKAGTGLGLAIAKNIVQAHRGKIGVQSKEGQGTTFIFTLPLSKGEIE